VIVQRARLSMLSGDRNRAIELATEGLGLSESLGIEGLQASALITRGTASGTDAAAVADLTRGVQIAESSKSIDELYRGLNNLSEYHLQLGVLDTPSVIYERIRGLAREYGHTAQLRWVDGQDVVHQFLLGNWDRSLEIANRMIAAEAVAQAHYLSVNAYQMRAQIGHAREEPGALAESERAVEYARRVGDAQALGPALASHALLLALDGERADAQALLQEVIDFYTANPTAPYTWSPPLVWAFAAVGDPDEYLTLLEREERTPWSDAARATCARDVVTAAEIYSRAGAAADAARARVHAAAALLDRGDRTGSEEQLARAIAFYRSVGATRRIRDAEKLLAATG
jgi:hypothetical protein